MAASRAQLQAELRKIEAELLVVQGKIDAAYWRFTRQARAKPPVLAEPAAHERRKELQARRNEIKAALNTETTMAKKKSSKKKAPPRVDKPKAKAGSKKKAAKKSAAKKKLTKSASKGACAAASIRHTQAATTRQRNAAMGSCEATEKDLAEFGKVGGEESAAARKGQGRVYMGRELK